MGISQSKLSSHQGAAPSLTASLSEARVSANSIPVLQEAVKRYKEPSAELLGAKAKSGREKKAERAQSSVKRDAAKEVSGTRMKQGVVVRMVPAGHALISVM